MSSESSMSSGSRIRQFGLYRTIDARTEEFLRLSRKRQIRQGCACAAVSTAITVTVVIVVFIVYEFSLNSEINLDNSLKSNWFNLMNVTSDGHFDSSFTKNVDPTTLQLLPMLIKALKKNVILEKVIEEHSSSSPLTDRKYTTDDYYNNQIFTKHWLKMPTSKLFTIEYKTSPVVYFRNPTKNIELFTKIRKVRDYQRIVNYIDKMINEKVYVGSTKPMLKGEMYTDSPVNSKGKHLSSIKTKKVHHKIDVPTYYNLRKADKKESSCKCPKNISMLFQKFMNTIQNVIPSSTTQITSENYSNQLMLQKPTVLKTEDVNEITTANDFFQETTPMEPEIKIVPKLNDDEETTQPFFNHTTTEDDYLINSSPLNLSNTFNAKEGEYIRSTTINNFFDGTDVEDTLYPTSTKPIEVTTENIRVKITTKNPNCLFKKYYRSNSQENTERNGSTKKSVARISNDTEYDDEFYSTTPKDREKDFINKLQSIKSKTVFNTEHQHKPIRNKDNKFRELPNDNNDIDIESSRFLKKLNSDLYKLIEQNARQLRSEISTSEDQFIEQNARKLRTKMSKSEQNGTQTTLEMTTSEAPSFATKPIETQVIKSSSSESVTTLNTTFPTANFEFDNTEDFDVKLLSSQMAPIEESNKKAIIKETKETEIAWENLDNVHLTSLKSMIPVDRPVYLEFHRNDFKHEEPTDFDYNINANIYDMPNN